VTYIFLSCLADGLDFDCKDKTDNLHSWFSVFLAYFYLLFFELIVSLPFLKKTLNVYLNPLFFHEKCRNLASELKVLNMEGKDLNRLKLVLVEKKRTGLWLAEQLGVSNTTVSKWCSNVTQPSLPTLDRIAEILHCEKRDLIND